jgi:hypothetical protein
MKRVTNALYRNAECYSLAEKQNHAAPTGSCDPSNANEHAALVIDGTGRRVARVAGDDPGFSGGNRSRD